MRHKKNFNHLGRKSGHRRAMLSNMASSLIMHKRIETTTAKAKALKRYIEPLITRSKEDSTHSRRVVFSYLQDKEAVTELFREVGAKVGDRPGGYTRIIKMGNRLGDNADMCLIELVDFNEIMLGAKAAAKKTTSRRRRGSKPKDETVAAPKVAAPAAVVETAPVVETEVVATEPVEEIAEEAEPTEAKMEDSGAPAGEDHHDESAEQVNEPIK
ncbi:MAG: 50S ribosomal protein L17 [Bacteroidales bacterium]